MARSLAKWNSLSPGYRSRLERSGITRDRYLSGERLTVARGHAHTPERPSRFRGQAEYQQWSSRHPNYTSGTTESVRKIDLSVQAVYDAVLPKFTAALDTGEITRFDATQLYYSIRVSSPIVRRIMIDMTVDEWRDQARKQLDSDYCITVKNSKGTNVKYNPFFYH